MKLIEGKNARSCSTCGKLKHFKKYYKKKSGKYGIHARCIKCEKYVRTKRKIIKNQDKNRQDFKNHILRKRECNKCKEYKSFDEFYKNKCGKYGIKSICKNCASKRQKEYNKRPDVKKKMRQYNKKWKENNPEKIRKQKEKYREENKEKIKEYNKKYYRENKEKMKNEYKKWRKNNSDYLNEYRRKKYNNDLNYKIKHNYRNRVNQTIKNDYKSEKTKELLGCSIDEFKQHLEDQFEKGMNWDNHGEWHIDHEIPCSAFDLSDPKQQAVCFHYSNMQPMWAEENIKKGNKIPNLFEDIEINNEF